MLYDDDEIRSFYENDIVNHGAASGAPKVRYLSTAYTAPLTLTAASPPPMRMCPCPARLS